MYVLLRHHDPNIYNRHDWLGDKNHVAVMTSTVDLILNKKNLIN